MIIALGRWSIIRLSIAADILTMIATALKNVLYVLRHGNKAIRSVLLKQLYFTGLEASGIIITIAVILGTVVITQVVNLVGSNGALMGKMLVWVVLRELAPLLTAMIVIARSGTAIAAELGSMKINGEIDSLEMMGIPTERYLLLPRIVGVTSSLVLLTIYFVMASCTAGFIIASVGWHIPFEQYSQGIISVLGGKEIALLFVKSSLFGLCISATCCSYGLSVGRSVTEIPQAATKAVMTSLVVVFMLDGMLSYLSAVLFH